MERERKKGWTDDGIKLISINRRRTRTPGRKKAQEKNEEKVI